MIFLIILDILLIYQHSNRQKTCSIIFFRMLTLKLYKMHTYEHSFYTDTKKDTTEAYEFNRWSDSHSSQKLVKLFHEEGYCSFMSCFYYLALNVGCPRCDRSFDGNMICFHIISSNYSFHHHQQRRENDN